MLYVNSATPLLWRCEVGHEWSAVPASVQKGSWCPACARVRRLNLEEIQELAESRGSKCLSDRYQNSATKLEWRCSTGHEWSVTPLQMGGRLSTQLLSTSAHYVPTCFSSACWRTSGTKNLSSLYPAVPSTRAGLRNATIGPFVCRNMLETNMLHFCWPQYFATATIQAVDCGRTQDTKCPGSRWLVALSSGVWLHTAKSV